MSREVRFTKQQRQEIIRDFCRRRNRDFDARLFEKEVRETGKKHAAWAWFQWDGDKAAAEYRIWQAREFAIGLTITFKVETITRGAPIKVREVTAPLLISAGSERRGGGGYTLTDPTNADHMRELCQQASADLSRWLRRYEGAVAHSGIDIDEIERFIKLLQQASPSRVTKKPRPSPAGAPRRQAAAAQRPAARPIKGGQAKPAPVRATR